LQSIDVKFNIYIKKKKPYIVRWVSPLHYVLEPRLHTYKRRWEVWCVAAPPNAKPRQTSKNPKSILYFHYLQRLDDTAYCNSRHSLQIHLASHLPWYTKYVYFLNILKNILFKVLFVRKLQAVIFFERKTLTNLSTLLPQISTIILLNYT
jgi:hypothetical protein